MIKIIATGNIGKDAELKQIGGNNYACFSIAITEKLKEIIQYDFHVTSIKPSNISEIVESKDTKDDKWFKAKVAIIDADTITGREKRSNVYFLVAGSDVNVALENLHKSLSTYLVPTDVVQVGDSNIMDVFPYFEDRQE